MPGPLAIPVAFANAQTPEVTTNLDTDFNYLAGLVLDNLTQLRATTPKTATSTPPRLFVDNIPAGAGTAAGFWYWFNAADTTSADNGASIIVAADGGRWYQIPPKGYEATAGEIAAGAGLPQYGIVNFGYFPYNVLRYGADPTGVASALTAFNAAYNAAMAATPHGAIKAPTGKYLIPNPGLTWTNQADITFTGDGPNLTHLIISGNNYTVLTISADTGAGTTGTNLILRDFGIGDVGFLNTNVNALALADYLFFNLGNLELNSSGNSLKMTGMALGVVDNVNCLTAGTNAAGNSALVLTTDTFNIGCGPIVFNACMFNGQSNVTAGGAVFSSKSEPVQFNCCIFIALGPAMTNVVAITNQDDVTFIECYCESSRNTTNNNADLFALGATSAPQSVTFIGGTYFSGASGHFMNRGINAAAVQALSVTNVTFAGFITCAIKYILTTAFMGEFRNIYSTGAGNPPVFDPGMAWTPSTQYLKSWSDPWPRLDASLAGAVANVTGDGTIYTVLFDTVNFDTTTMYAAGTGIATIPGQGAGMYDVSASVVVNGLAAAWTNYELDIVQKTSGGALVTTHAVNINPGAVRNAANQATLFQSCLLKCSGGDQIFITVAVSGSTKNIGVVGAGTEYTRFNLRYVG